jgi:HIRAN domain
MTQPNYIQHIIEPKKLLLSWQPKKEGNASRLRRFVAELVADGKDVRLEYLLDSEEVSEAKKVGFEEYFGFPIKDRVHKNVLAAFMRRLPPRKREDFSRFLTAIRINPDDVQDISDFALLGYSGAVLPGDDFTIINPFSNAEPPFELLIGIQGYRHYLDNVPYDYMNTGSQVTFEPQPTNHIDSDAIKVLMDDKLIGYVCRGLNKSFNSWLDKGYNIEAAIERINGTPDSPKIYALVKVTGSL